MRGPNKEALIIQTKVDLLVRFSRFQAEAWSPANLAPHKSLSQLAPYFPPPPALNSPPSVPFKFVSGLIPLCHGEPDPWQTGRSARLRLRRVQVVLCWLEDLLNIGWEARPLSLTDSPSGSLWRARLEFHPLNHCQ